jgi:hypothetical protein
MLKISAKSEQLSPLGLKGLKLLKFKPKAESPFTMTSQQCSIMNFQHKINDIVKIFNSVWYKNKSEN